VYHELSLRARPEATIVASQNATFLTKAKDPRGVSYDPVVRFFSGFRPVDRPLLPCNLRA
jgi:hypothetical protein